MSINIFGVIGEDVRASDIIKKMQAVKGDRVELNIMSPGGSVVEGMAIYDFARNMKKKIVTRAMGQACSIASVIFMAGDEREIADNAEIMIHNAMVFAGGNKHQLKEYADRLDGIDQKLINIYTSRTSLNEKEVRDMLDNETFMSADEAVKKGFATSKANALELVAQYNRITNKQEAIMANEKQSKEGFFNHLMAYFRNEDMPENPENMEEEEEEKPVDSLEKAEGEEPEKESPEAMEEEESEEVKSLKAELENVKQELAEAKAKAEDEPKAVKKEVIDVVGLILDAVTDDKITMHEAKNLSSKSLVDVKDVLDKKEINETGRGKAATPKSEVADNVYDQYKAISDPSERNAFFAKHKNEIINKSKES